MDLDRARTVADAVLYEGYLLYPYRATSSKNQARWQFGVLGPAGAADAGIGEDARMSAECVLRGPDDATVTVRLRFLQLQLRQLERAVAAGAESITFETATELTVDGQLRYSWDEAVEHELAMPASGLAAITDGICWTTRVEGGEDAELIHDDSGALVGRTVRRRWPLSATVRLQITTIAGHRRLGVAVENTGAPATDPDSSIRTSLIGTHLLIETSGARFVSLLDPSADATEAVGQCRQHRCWPVLAGGDDDDLLLVSPIILYDHPAVAEQSRGALFDATEIDEILTLRVMTMTDQEKVEARATDPRAAAIIARCDEMTPADLAQLHGILRNPYAGGDPDTLATPEPAPPPWFDTGEAPWWDPAVDARVQPDVDVVLIDGVSVSRGSLVRVHPSRRADAQDLFFADQVARVTAVLNDVDGGTHVALVLVDDPAADLQEESGRFLYFAPDELEPLPVASGLVKRKD